MYLDRYKKNAVKPNTYAKYHGLLKNHIVSEIGWIKLQQLRSNHIQKLYNDMIDKGISPSTIKHTHILIYQALAQAVNERYIFVNFAESTTKPRIIRSEVQVITQDQQEKLLNYIINDDIGICIKIAISTGLRIGEILGLQWNDFDFLKKVLSVRRTLARVRYLDEFHGKTCLELTDLKTKCSNRDIPISDELISALAEYKVWQETIATTYIKPNTQNMLFWSNLSSSGYANIDRFTDRFQDILKANEIPKIKFHALRHTFATRILEANIHPKIAQELLGHESCEITLDVYSHVLPSAKSSALDIVQILKKKSTTV